MDDEPQVCILRTESGMRFPDGSLAVALHLPSPSHFLLLTPELAVRLGVELIYHGRRLEEYLKDGAP